MTASGASNGGDDTEPASFERWYAESFPRIGPAVSMAIGDVEAAADATAEAYSRALERWDRVGDMANPDGWVYRVAVNDARRRFRRWRRTFPHDERPASSPDPADMVADRGLWDAVCTLHRRQREAIALRYVAGLDERGVAEAMGITEGAASSQLTAARARLRQILEEEGP